MKAKVKEFEKKLVRVRVRVNLTLFYREKIMSI
jgi:hypothetical protein